MGCFESKQPRVNPTAARGCTDICWLIIFILFWVILVSNLIYINLATPREREISHA